MLTLDVRGLPRSMTEASLQQLFAAHGRVFGLRMAKDAFSGECKGFAELKMTSHEARNAVVALNGSTHNGTMVRVALHDDGMDRHADFASQAHGGAEAGQGVHMNYSQRERSIREDTGLLGNNAFMGSASLSVGQTHLVVHALCWPIVPTAWRSLAQAWDSVGGWREETDAPGKPASPSWIAECAAQLGSPFRGTTAEESTIAAILTRTPMSVAISVADGADTHKAIQRQGFLGCLSSYDTYVKVPGRRACTILVARDDGGATGQGHLDAFAHARQRLPTAEWLQNMELRCWTDSMASLPLEAAHVIATSIARYRGDGNVANPIVDAIRTKLAYPLALLDRPPKKRR